MVNSDSETEGVQVMDKPQKVKDKVVIDLTDTRDNIIAYATDHIQCHSVQLGKTVYEVFSQAFLNTTTIKGTWRHKTSGSNQTDKFIQEITNNYLPIEDNRDGDDMVEERLRLVRQFVEGNPKLPLSDSKTSPSNASSSATSSSGTSPSASDTLTMQKQENDFLDACRIYWVDYLLAGHITPLPNPTSKQGESGVEKYKREREWKQTQHRRKHEFFFTLIQTHNRASSPYYSIFQWMHKELSSVQITDLRTHCQRKISWPKFDRVEIQEFAESQLLNTHLRKCIELDMWVSLNALLHCRHTQLLPEKNPADKGKQTQSVPVYTLTELKSKFPRDVHDYYFAVLDSALQVPFFSSKTIWSFLVFEQSYAYFSIKSCLGVETAFPDLREVVEMYSDIRGLKIDWSQDDGRVQKHIQPQIKDNFANWIEQTSVVFDTDSLHDNLTTNPQSIKGVMCYVSRLVDWVMKQRRQPLGRHHPGPVVASTNVLADDVLQQTSIYPISSTEQNLHSKSILSSRLSQRAKQLHGEDHVCPDFDTFCSILASWQPHFYHRFYEDRYVFWQVYQGQLVFVEESNTYVQKVYHRSLPMQNVYLSLKTLIRIFPISDRYEGMQTTPQVQKYLLQEMEKIKNVQELKTYMEMTTDLFPEEQVITWNHYFTNVNEMDQHMLNLIGTSSPLSKVSEQAIPYERWMTHALVEWLIKESKNKKSAVIHITDSLSSSFEQAMLKYFFPNLCLRPEDAEAFEEKRAFKWFETCEYSIFADWIRQALEIFYNIQNLQEGCAITPNQLASVFEQMVKMDITHVSYYALYNKLKNIPPKAGENASAVVQFCDFTAEPHLMISCCVVLLLKKLCVTDLKKPIESKYTESVKNLKSPNKEIVENIWEIELDIHSFLPTAWMDMTFIRLYYVLRSFGITTKNIKNHVPRMPDGLPEEVNSLNAKFKKNIADLFYRPANEEEMPICFVQEFIKMHADWVPSVKEEKEYDPSSRFIVRRLFHNVFPRLSEKRVWDLYKQDLPDNTPNLHRVLLWEYVFTRQIQDMEMLYEYRHEVYQLYVCKHHELTTHYTTLDQHIQLQRPEHDLHTYFAEPLSFMTGDKYDLLRKLIRVLPIPKGVHREARIAHFHQCVQVCVKKNMALRFAIMAHDLISLFYHHGGPQYYDAMIQEFVNSEIGCSPILVTELACFQVMVESFARDIPRFYHANMFRDLFTFRPRFSQTRYRFCHNTWGTNWSYDWLNHVQKIQSQSPALCSYTLCSQQWQQVIDHSTSAYQMMLYACRNVYTQHTWKNTLTADPQAKNVWRQVYKTRSPACQEYMNECRCFSKLNVNSQSATACTPTSSLSFMEWQKTKHSSMSLSALYLQHWIPPHLKFMEKCGMLILNLPECMIKETLPHLRQLLPQNAEAGIDQIVCSNVHDFEYYAHLHFRPWILYERNTCILPLHQQAIFWQSEQGFLYARLKLWLEGRLHLHRVLGSKQWYYQMMHKNLNMQYYTKSFPSGWMIWPKYWRNVYYYPTTLQLDNNDFSTLVSHKAFVEFWSTKQESKTLNKYTEYPHYGLWEYLTRKLYIPFVDHALDKQTQSYLEAYNCWMLHKHPTTLTMICKNKDFIQMVDSKKGSSTQPPVKFQPDTLKSTLSKRVKDLNSNLLLADNRNATIDMIVYMKGLKATLEGLQKQQQQQQESKENLKKVAQVTNNNLFHSKGFEMLQGMDQPGKLSTPDSARSAKSLESTLGAGTIPTAGSLESQIQHVQRQVDNDKQELHNITQVLKVEVAAVVRRQPYLRNHPWISWISETDRALAFI